MAYDEFHVRIYNSLMSPESSGVHLFKTIKGVEVEHLFSGVGPDGKYFKLSVDDMNQIIELYKEKKVQFNEGKVSVIRDRQVSIYPPLFDHAREVKGTENGSKRGISWLEQLNYWHSMVRPDGSESFTFLHEEVKRINVAALDGMQLRCDYLLECLRRPSNVEGRSMSAEAVVAEIFKLPPIIESISYSELNERKESVLKLLDFAFKKSIPAIDFSKKDELFNGISVHEYVAVLLALSNLPTVFERLCDAGIFGQALKEFFGKSDGPVEFSKQLLNSSILLLSTVFLILPVRAIFSYISYVRDVRQHDKAAKFLKEKESQDNPDAVKTSFSENDSLSRSAVPVTTLREFPSQAAPELPAPEFVLGSQSEKGHKLGS
ncbi:MAG: hypothetical protein V4490_03730 [Pseudomonadota bacterium]